MKTPPSQKPRAAFYAVQLNPGWIPRLWAVQAVTATRKEADALAQRLNQEPKP